MVLAGLALFLYAAWTTLSCESVTALHAWHPICSKKSMTLCLFADRDMLKLTQQEFEGVPLLVKAEVLIASVVCMWGKRPQQLMWCLTAAAGLCYILCMRNCSMLLSVSPLCVTCFHLIHTPCRQLADFWEFQTFQCSQRPKVSQSFLETASQAARRPPRLALA